MNVNTNIILLIGALILPFSAWAAPEISLSVRAEIEKTVEEDGKQVVKRVEASKVEPGQEVIYVVSYSNTSDEGAFNVKLNNQIPQNTTYKPDSAWGNNAELQFSIDNGQSFKKPSLLIYEVDNNGEKEERKASPDKYTNIRWIVKEIPGQSKGEVGFRVTVN